MKTVTFVLGLQGVGKSTYIKEHFDGAAIIDYDELRVITYDLYSEMDRYEVPTYYKLSAVLKLVEAIAAGNDQIVVECTGMTKVGQAALRFLMDMAGESEGYELKVIYLRPADVHAYEASIQDDEAAATMFNEIRGRHPRWRRPDECPYFPEVEVIEINHGEEYRPF